MMMTMMMIMIVRMKIIIFKLSIVVRVVDNQTRSKYLKKIETENRRDERGEMRGEMRDDVIWRLKENNKK